MAADAKTSPLEFVRELYASRGFDGLWKWGIEPKGANAKAANFRILEIFAERQRDAEQPNSPARDEWAHRRQVYASERDKYEKRAAATHEAVDWAGHVPVLGDAGIVLVRKAATFGLIVTATTDGVHAPTSYHYLKRAIDFGVIAVLVGTPEDTRRMVAFQQWCYDNRSLFVEVFGPTNDRCVKNGQPLTLAEGSALENQHDTHVHCAE